MSALRLHFPCMNHDIPTPFAISVSSYSNLSVVITLKCLHESHEHYKYLTVAVCVVSFYP